MPRITVKLELLHVGYSLSRTPRGLRPNMQRLEGGMHHLKTQVGTQDFLQASPTSATYSTQQQPQPVQDQHMQEDISDEDTDEEDISSILDDQQPTTEQEQLPPKKLSTEVTPTEEEQPEFIYQELKMLYDNYNSDSKLDDVIRTCITAIRPTFTTFTNSRIPCDYSLVRHSEFNFMYSTTEGTLSAVHLNHQLTQEEITDIRQCNIS